MCSGCPTGKDIPIEERDPDEVRRINGEYICPPDVKVFNPAFDVTPAGLISAIVTEKGIARAPYAESLARLAGPAAPVRFLPMPPVPRGALKCWV